MPRSIHAIIPKVTKHATGQAAVRLNGKDYYLGKYDSPKAHRGADRLIGKWLLTGRGRRTPTATAGPTLNEIVLSYFTHCRDYYRKPDGKETSELCLIRIALKHLLALFGDTKAEAFGPLSLISVRHRMIEANLSRKVINRHVGRIKQMFQWADENELIRKSVNHRLRDVKGLKKNRSNAREFPKVKPAPEAMVYAIQPHVARQVWALIQLQLPSTSPQSKKGNGECEIAFTADRSSLRFGVEELYPDWTQKKICKDMFKTCPAATLAWSPVHNADADDAPDNAQRDPARDAKPIGMPRYRSACTNVHMECLKNRIHCSGKFWRGRRYLPLVLHRQAAAGKGRRRPTKPGSSALAFIPTQPSNAQGRNRSPGISHQEVRKFEALTGTRCQRGCGRRNRRHPFCF